MLDSLMVFATVAGLPALVLVPAHLIAKRRHREGYALLGVVVAAGLIAVELQFLTLRARPTHPMIPMPDFPSFPSGHAAIAFAFATMATLMWRRRGAWTVPVATLIAASRLYVGHHFVADVLIGSIVGAAIGAVGYGFFYVESHPTRPRWSWLLWLQLAVVAFATTGAYLGLTHWSALKLPGADKFLHFTLFGALGALLVGWLPKFRAPAVLGVLAALATIEEFTQAWSPARTFDWVDLLATLSGIVIIGWIGSRARVRWARQLDVLVH